MNATSTQPQAAPERRENLFTSSDPASSDPSLTTIGHHRKVMVVDDDAVVLKAFENRFKASGFEVTTVSDLATAVTSARTQNPDLVILDVNFTDDKTFTTLKWDGFSVAQWFRRFEDLRSIPIVLISGDTSAATKEKALESGADAYFAKPMDFRQLLTTVLPMLGERTAAAG